MRVLSEQQLKEFKKAEKLNKSLFTRLYDALTKGDVQKLWRDGYRAGVSCERNSNVSRSKKMSKSEEMAEITVALSQGYCTKKNEKKELDIDLVNAMGTKVAKVLKKVKQ